MDYSALINATFIITGEPLAVTIQATDNIDRKTATHLSSPCFKFEDSSGNVYHCSTQQLEFIFLRQI